MRIPMKAILVSTSIVYSSIVTIIAKKQHNKIDILSAELKKTKKKVKKYKKELKMPIYRRSILPRNGKPTPKTRPEFPIGFC